MKFVQLQPWSHSVVVLLIIFPLLSLAVRDESSVKTSVFLSPKFVMTPGSVVNRFYHNIEFPRGHIGIKSFNAEVVDSSGAPVPLHQTYLHHWVVGRYYQRRGVAEMKASNGSFDPNSNLRAQNSDSIHARNSGICQNLGQYFGLGSETRKTPTEVPDAYAIEVGNPGEIPDGYDERWVLNVHAIDTRSVEDKQGCTECRCDLYNVTVDEYGRRLRPDYVGGLFCCYDQTQCRLNPGSEPVARELYLKYTVKWVEWTSKLLPVKIYIFDVTDTWEAPGVEHHCRVEYEVEQCKSSEHCIYSRRSSIMMPKGGHIVYGVAHQHSGGAGSSLYREEGGEICSSVPSYGKGEEAGDEAGYIVGMSTCYPRPGSVKIANGERLVLVSNYSSAQHHTGVMGLFYILVADQLPTTENCLSGFVERLNNSNLMGSAVLVMGVVLLAVASVVGYRRRMVVQDGYHQITV